MPISKTSLSFTQTSQTKSPSQFGGFSSQQAQTQALQQAIRESRQKNPEEFIDKKTGKEYAYVGKVLSPSYKPQQVQRAQRIQAQPIALAQKIQSIEAPSQFNTPIITKSAAQFTQASSVGKPSATVQSQQTYNQYTGNIPGQIQDAVVGGITQAGQGQRNLGEDYYNIANLDYEDKSLINRSIGKVFEGDFDEAGRIITSSPAQLAGELTIEIPLTIVPIGPVTKAVKAAGLGLKAAAKQLLATPAVIKQGKPAEKRVIEKILDKSKNTSREKKALENWVKRTDRRAQKEIDRIKKLPKASQQFDNITYGSPDDAFVGSGRIPGGYSRSSTTEAALAKNVIKSLENIATDKTIPQSARDKAIRVIEKHTKARGVKVYPTKKKFDDASKFAAIGAAAVGGTLGVNEVANNNAAFGGFSLLPSIPQAEAFPAGAIVKGATKLVTSTKPITKQTTKQTKQAQQIKQAQQAESFDEIRRRRKLGQSRYAGQQFTYGAGIAGTAGALATLGQVQEAEALPFGSIIKGGSKAIKNVFGPVRSKPKYKYKDTDNFFYDQDGNLTREGAKVYTGESYYGIKNLKYTAPGYREVIKSGGKFKVGDRTFKTKANAERFLKNFAKKPGRTTLTTKISDDIYLAQKQGVATPRVLSNTAEKQFAKLDPDAPLAGSFVRDYRKKFITRSQAAKLKGAGIATGAGIAGLSQFGQVQEAEAFPGIGPVAKKIGSEAVDFGKLLYNTGKGMDVEEYYTQQATKQITKALPKVTPKISNERTLKKIKQSRRLGQGVNPYPSKSYSKKYNKLLDQEFKGPQEDWVVGPTGDLSGLVRGGPPRSVFDAGLAQVRSRGQKAKFNRKNFAVGTGALGAGIASLSQFGQIPQAHAVPFVGPAIKGVAKGVMKNRPLGQSSLLQFGEKNIKAVASSRAPGTSIRSSGKNAGKIIKSGGKFKVGNRTFKTQANAEKFLKRTGGVPTKPYKLVKAPTQDYHPAPFGQPRGNKYIKAYALGTGAAVAGGASAAIALNDPRLKTVSLTESLSLDGSLNIPTAQATSGVPTIITTPTKTTKVKVGNRTFKDQATANKFIQRTGGKSLVTKSGGKFKVGNRTFNTKATAEKFIQRIGGIGIIRQKPKGQRNLAQEQREKTAELKLKPVTRPSGNRPVLTSSGDYSRATFNRKPQDTNTSYRVTGQNPVTINGLANPYADLYASFDKKKKKKGKKLAISLKESISFKDE